VRRSIAKFVTLGLGAATLAGIGYTALAIARVRAFREAAARYRPRCAAGVTILKPLHGDEPHLFENLCSFCEQDYPEFQVLFAAADPRDPALEVAREVARRFPRLDITIVDTHGARAANPKIANVLAMMPYARHGLIVVADSDIRVGPAYLHAVASCFDDSRTGAATCVYGGVPNPTLTAQLGAMHVNDHFAPSVLVANALEDLTYCFGATMAVRREVLEQIGGFEALADRLADDYVLGNRVSAAGYRVALVPYAVATRVADESLRALWRHERRWARTIAGQRRIGYAGSVLTYALPLATVFYAAARTRSAAALCLIAAAARARLHYEARRTFAPGTRPAPWLIPLRDALSVAVWASAFFARRVHWQDAAYAVEPDGRMIGSKEM